MPVASVDFIVNKVHILLKHRKPAQIDLNPDCGFGTFAECPVNTAEVAVGQATGVLREQWA